MAFDFSTVNTVKTINVNLIDELKKQMIDELKNDLMTQNFIKHQYRGYVEYYRYDMWCNIITKDKIEKVLNKKSYKNNKGLRYEYNNNIIKIYDDLDDTLFMSVYMDGNKIDYISVNANTDVTYWQDLVCLQTGNKIHYNAFDMAAKEYDTFYVNDFNNEHKVFIVSKTTAYPMKDGNTYITNGVVNLDETLSEIFSKCIKVIEAWNKKH